MKAKDPRKFHRHIQSLIKRKRLSEALSLLQEESRNTQDTGLLDTLAEVLTNQAQHGAALRALQRALALDPNRAETHRRLGILWAKTGEKIRAESAFRKALSLQPTDIDSLLALGELYLQINKTPGAGRCFQAALNSDPSSPRAHFGLAATLARSQHLEQAIHHLERAVALKPRNAEYWEALGACAERSLRYNLAMDAYRRSAALRPRDAGPAADLARILEHVGEHQAALKQLTPFLNQRPLSTKMAVAYARIAPHVDRVADATDAVEQTLAQQLEAYNRRELLFHLGQLRDRAGDYDRAFQAFSEANRLMYRGFDRERLARATDLQIRTFGRGYSERLPRSRVESEQPVFVVGMLRSGTTLVEQILAAHPGVYGAGELSDIGNLADSLNKRLPQGGYPVGLVGADPALLTDTSREYLRHLESKAQGEYQRIIDKMPGNFGHLGLISLLFPGARVIHCVRDPVDTCLSILSLKFDGHHPYAYDQGDLGFFYQEYLRLMTHWQQVLEIPMLEVHYEHLVGNQEAQSRRLVEFLGLEWDEACLRFHESGRKAHTASYDQVRRPIYTSSVQRWRHYEKHLRPLLTALGRRTATAEANSGEDSRPIT